MQTTPFVFGRIASSPNFTDREKEVAVLKTNFRSMVNTIIISPRRWGKSSLVAKVTEQLALEEPQLRICSIDLFNVRTEEDFYITLAREVLKATATKWEESVTNARSFLSRLIPRISFSPDEQSEISFGIGWDELKKNPEEILDLADAIAKAKGFQMVLCIDEFQNIAEFEHPVAFQRKLRAHWQRHNHVAYCLFGSKRHMLLDVFSSSSMPFYKFGHLMFLQKIATAGWIPFIQERFKSTEKEISEQDSTLITQLADNHPYYVQQLAQQAWFRTGKSCSQKIVEEAHETLVNQLSLLFTGTIETMPLTQLGFLKAVLAGEKQLSAQKTLVKYKLGTSGNVSRLKKSLFDKEIIDVEKETIVFQDPIFAFWLKNYYFNC
jgi:AAA+ ATPase superfamily predicted ATPase